MTERLSGTDLRCEVKKNLDYIVSIREELHRYPELSGEETRTAALVRQELQKFGVEDVRAIAHTGVTALIKGDLPGPVVLLRADMDALAVTETADVPYKSVTSGIMHACGHDGHTASLLGVAKILSENRHMLQGSVRLAFQPAEEGAGGALRMIEEGILENPKVDYAFAFHVLGTLDEGKIGVRSGGLWASCDDIVINLTGRGGHISQPYKCVSPILMGIEAVNRLNTYLAQSCRGDLGAVLAFGQFSSGSTCNIIPQTAELKGTLRTYDEESRKILLAKLEQSFQQAAAFHGGECRINAHFFAPACRNDPKLTGEMTALLQKHCGPERLVLMTEPATGAEDFAFFSQKTPSFYFMLGIRPAGSPDILLHNPGFKWDSRLLEYSGWAMLNMVFNLTDFVKP